MPSTTTVHIETQESIVDPVSDTRQPLTSRLRQLGNLVRRVSGGPRETAITVRSGVRFAGGTVALSSGSGTINTVINGVTIGITWATSDTVSAGLIVAAVNASTDALVQNIVVAGNLANTITCSSAVVNATVKIGDVTLLSKGGTAGNYNEFDVSGNDAADGTALRNCINSHPVLSQYFWAQNSSGVVTVYCKSATFPSGFSNYCVGSDASIAFGAAAFAAGATACITSKRRGVMGNCVTLSASGTGATASGARLTLGTEQTT